MKKQSFKRTYQAPVTQWLLLDVAAAFRPLCNSVSIPELSEEEVEFDWI